MNKFGRALAALLLVSAMVLAPALDAAPAYAAYNDPIEPVNDRPSSWTGAGKTTLTEDEAIIRKYEIDLSRDVKQPRITMGRMIGAFSIAEAAFMMIGIGGEFGVRIAAGFTGENPDLVRCRQPDWFNTTNQVLTFGAFGGCPLTLQEPNLGEPTSVNFPGVGRSVKVIYRDFGDWQSSIMCQYGQSLFGTPNAIVISYTGRFTGPAQTTGSGRFESSICTAAGSDRGSEVTSCYVGHIDPRAVTCSGLTITGASYVVTSTGQVIEQGVMTVSDPPRQARCTMEKKSGGMVYSDWVPYLESQGYPTDAIATECNHLIRDGVIAPDDVGGVGIETEKVGDGGSRTSIVETEVPDEVDLSQGRKSLLLMKVVSGAWVSCLVNAQHCVNWWSETNQGSSPGDYECRYGSEVVPMAECEVYKNTFKEDTYGTIDDPVTGDRIKWKTGTGNSLDPGEVIDPSGDCMRDWPSAPNPVEWVLHPVKCAMVWAFVPRPTVVASTTVGITTAWQGSAFGQWADAVTGWGFVPPPSGCSGVEIPIGDIFGHGIDNFNVLEACPGDPLQPLAIMSSIVIGIMAVIGLIWVATGALGGVVGYRGLNGGGS